MVRMKKVFDKQIRLPMTQEMLDALDAAKRPGEDRTDIIRLAIERELVRRERSAAKQELIE